MTVKYAISFKATGRGAKSAMKEAEDDLCSLTDAIYDAASDWAKGNEGEHDDPKVEWEVELSVERAGENNA